MPFPLLVGAFIGLCKVCAVVGGTIFCTHKITKAYQKGQKTKQAKIAAKSQTDMAKIDAAQSAAKQAQTDKEEISKKLKEQEAENEKLAKEVEQAKNNSQNPNLSEDERQFWRSKWQSLEDQLKKGKEKSKSLFDLIKAKEKTIADNNRVISQTSTGSYDDNHWIFNLITLENFLILGGCYVLYKLVKDDK